MGIYSESGGGAASAMRARWLAHRTADNGPTGVDNLCCRRTRQTAIHITPTGYRLRSAAEMEIQALTMLITAIFQQRLRASKVKVVQHVRKHPCARSSSSIAGVQFQ